MVSRRTVTLCQSDVRSMHTGNLLRAYQSLARAQLSYTRVQAREGLSTLACPTCGPQACDPGASLPLSQKKGDRKDDTRPLSRTLLAIAPCP